MAQFDTYEEALEAAADLKVEIADVFKPQLARQSKIFQGLWKPWKNKDLTFVRDIMLYQAGYPQEDSRAKIEGFRDKLAALVHIYDALDLLENLNKYLADLGVKVEVTDEAVFKNSIYSPKDKVKECWDAQFFGEDMATSGPEVLSMLIENAKTTKFDINAIEQQIDEIADQVEIDFGVKKSAFKRAVDIQYTEKIGKSVDEKIEAIEESRKALDKALAPFIGEEDESN